MSAHEQNPKEKAATLTLALRADSGYEADAEYRISAEQWGEILGLCEGTRPAPAEPVNARLLDVATGKIPHIYAGLCPDAGSGSRSRDPECPACRAISAAEAQQADEWISVADAMPRTQQQVDIAYIDHHGQPQTTIGWYCRAKTLESSSFDGEVDDEYDEETDTHYLKEQWVDESQESEYHYPITRVTHWKPRAKHPDFKPQAKGD